MKMRMTKMMTMMKRWKPVLLGVLLLMLVVGVVACKEQSPEPEPLEQLAVPEGLCVEKRIVTWEPVMGASGYLVRVDGVEYEAVDCRFELYFLTEGGTYSIDVLARGDGELYLDSEWSEITVNLKKLTEHGYDEHGYEYTLLEDKSGYSVQRGNASIRGAVTIPDYFEGYPVTEITSYFFVDTSGMGAIPDNTVTTGVHLPEHLERIAHHAFLQCTMITEIVIPDSVTEIGELAFSACENLTRVTLPKNLREIPQGCFFRTKLSEIVIPDTVERIGEGAFASMDALFAMDPIASELSKVVIPVSVKEIGEGAFRGRERLATIQMSSKNIEAFGQDVFAGTAWYALQPDGLIYFGELLYGYKGEMPENFVYEATPETTKIAGGAFENQDNLQKAVLRDGMLLLGNSVFSGCNGLSEVILPGDLKTISDRMFSNAESLKQITLPEGIVTIGLRAFSGSGLESITIPASVRTIGESAFEGCEALKAVVVPEGVESLGARAFQKCSTLETAYLPASLQKLREYAFQKDDALKAVYYAGSRADFDALIASMSDIYKEYYYTVYPMHYYSEQEPSDDGNYWHYVDGKIAVWAKKES